MNTWEQKIILWVRKWSVPMLRVALGIVFLWFGALKIFGASPVMDLIHKTYTFLPTREFVFVLGIWEVIIGIGFLTKRFLRITLVLFLAQMIGTLFSFVLCPQLFFSPGNVFLLSSEGEFVIKNLVLISAGLVIAGHEIKDRQQL